MKSLYEINHKVRLLKISLRTDPYATLKVQALEWATKTIETEGISRGEEIIGTRIFKLNYRQEKRERVPFAKPARAAQITALEWVIEK